MTTPDLSAALLAEWRDTAEAATPGPWAVELGNWSGAEPWHQYRPAVPVPGRPFGGDPLTIEEDAEFCVTARTALPRTIAALEAVLAIHRTVAACDQGVDCCAKCSDCDTWLMSPDSMCPTTAAITAALHPTDMTDGGSDDR